ncbi:MAG: hypothetical protein Q9197_002143 [Variospora fuerteventurae]
MEPFPLMQLPLELRELVYGQFLTPSERDYHDSMFDDCEVDNVSKQIRIQAEERQVAVKDSKNRANLLATSKQVNAEATAVWYRTQHITVSINEWMTIGGSSSLVSSVLLLPTYLPKIRNLHICLMDHGKLLELGMTRIHSHSTVKHLERLCYELAAYSHGLTNIVFEFSCICALKESGSGSGRPLTQDENSCLPADIFQQLLKPLERLRASRSTTFKCSCRNMSRYQQPVFNKLAAMITSSEPVPDLEGPELVYWKLQERARPFMEADAMLCKMLHWTHCISGIASVHPEDGVCPQRMMQSARSKEEEWAVKCANALYAFSFGEMVQRVEEYLDKLEIIATSAKEKSAENEKAATCSKGKKRKAEAMAEDGKTERYFHFRELSGMTKLVFCPPLAQIPSLPARSRGPTNCR